MKNLYHLSPENHDGETFEPRQIPKWRAMEGEDWKIRRICASPTIDGALTSLLSSDSQPFGKHLFVHVPESIDGSSLEKKKIYVPTKKKVPDVEATGEVWIKVPVKMKCIGEVEVVDIDPNVDVSYDDNGQKISLDRFVWKWLWHDDNI